MVPSTATEDFDYYTDLTEKGDAVFYRVHTEELTGQTDRAERPKRQRWFQDIFISDEIPAVNAIDLLNVTTTMEAGVDIGGLNAVMMANMPPRRFNYQQRVGRAGRRTSSVSLAVTFCRGRSHDDFYFQRPESITGDPPPAPYVDMRSEPIFRRVLIKEALRQAFSSCITFDSDDDEHGGDSVHGEFGTVTEWPAYAQPIQDWLEDPNNEPHLIEALDALCIETRLPGGAGPQFKADMLAYLRQDLVPKINRVIQDESYTQEALSERLANAGLLPMFGFPTLVRLLYTKWPYQPHPWPPETGIVDRTLDVAISQFAPGSQTVKDKAVHTAVGVVDFYPAGIVQTDNGLYPPLPEANKHLLIGLCHTCQAVIVPSPAVVASPLSGGIEPAKTICPVCQDQEPSLRTLDAREPKGFFTDLYPSDFEGQFEWSPRSTRPSLSINDPANAALAPTGTVNNTAISAVSDHIYSINDNGGVGGFDFQAARYYGKPQAGAFTVAESSAATEGPYPPSPISAYGPASRVALLSRRLTDVLVVNIDKWPDGVFADPTTVSGRAAWYSFAFWLRIAAGDLLDVDAQELQTGFQSLSNGAHAIGQAFLCDQLENGAGYCRELARPSEFQRLLAQADPMTPETIAAKWMEVNVPQGAPIPHSQECDTSCNRCLRDFANLPYHGLLDWRLALDMARLASSHGSTVDLTSDWGSAPNPWFPIIQGPNAPVPAVLRRLYYDGPTMFSTLQGYVHQTYATVLLERHPLWRNDHPAWLAAEASVRSQYPHHEVRPINPFTVLRRPGECVPVIGVG